MEAPVPCNQACGVVAFMSRINRTVPVTAARPGHHTT